MVAAFSRACSSIRVSKISRLAAAHKRNRSANSVRRCTPRGGGDSKSLVLPASNAPPASKSSRPSHIVIAKRSRNCAGTWTWVWQGSASIRSCHRAGNCLTWLASAAGAGARCAGAGLEGRVMRSAARAGRDGSAVPQWWQLRDQTERSPRQCGQKPRLRPHSTSAPCCPSSAPRCCEVKCRTRPRAVPRLL